jgi:hypothetical protein
MTIIATVLGDNPLLAGVVGTLTLMAAYHWATLVRYPPNLPRVGEKPGAQSFSWRTRMAYYRDCKALIFEAYEKVHTAHGISMTESLKKAQ